MPQESKNIQSPFKFLDAYQKEDIDIFFGRDKETENLYHALSGVKHLLVYGSSGAGKTSLIECGLRNQFSDADWFALTVRKGDDMTASVFNVVNNALEEKVEIDTETGLPTDKNLDFENIIEQLFEECYQPVYLLFDQFEELLISGSQEEQKDFFIRLNRLIRNRVPCRVLLIMREEFIGHLSEFEQYCPTLFQHRFRVEKIRKTDVSNIIIQTLSAPKFANNFEVQNAAVLADTILSKLPDSKREIELTHVQVFLSELWDRAFLKSNGNLPVLKKELVETSDNLERILDSFLQKQLQEMDKVYGEKIALELLACMITERSTKLQLTESHLAVDLKDRNIELNNSTLSTIITDFIRRKILREVKINNTVHYEISHDILALVIGKSLTEEMQMREKAKGIYEVYEDRQGLFSKEDLDYLRVYEIFLPFSESLSDRINKSYIQIEGRLQRRKRRNRRIVWILSIAAFICLAFAGWALWESQQAERAKIEAEKERDNARTATKEAKKQENKAKEERKKAEKAKIEAEEARKKAEIAKKEAEEARKEAENQKDKAEAATKGAQMEKLKAEAARDRAEAAEVKARKAKVLAEAAGEKAEKAERLAKAAEAEAQKLKLQKLAEVIAIKSVSMENKPIVQAQVAKKAMEILQASEGSNAQVYNPEIYTALYFGIKGLKKDKDFNQYPASKKDTYFSSIHQIISGDNTIYSAGSDGIIRKWTIESPSNKVDKPMIKKPSTIERKTKETVLAMDYRNGKLVTAGKDRRVSVFDTNTGKLDTTFNLHHNRFVWDVAFIGKNKIISSGQDKNIVLTDLATNKSRVLLQTKTNTKKIVVHIDNAMIMIGDDAGVVSLIDVKMGKTSKTKNLVGGGITALQFSPSGKYLAVGNVKGKLYLLNFPSLTEVKYFDAHNSAITDIQFNGSSNFITTSRDKTAKYWNIQKIENISRYEPLVFNNHNDWCTAAAFIGNQAMVGCKDGSIKFWALDVSTLSDELCRLLKVEDETMMNDKDWDKYIGGDAKLIDMVGKRVCEQIIIIQ
jgi:WD40 repeat protein